MEARKVLVDVVRLMGIPFTPTQRQRLLELDADESLVEASFDDEAARDGAFRRLHEGLAAASRERLEALRRVGRRPALRRVERLLADVLAEAGFVEVLTPTLLPRGTLARMGVDEGHPLFLQVYWVGADQCLRPMLAPNLYHFLAHPPRCWGRPLGLFEIGSCFRKETKGARHLSEFTMLNLVEMGMAGDPQTRLLELVDLVMTALGLSYGVQKKTSAVYGVTTDVIVRGEELASGAVGPHRLDAAWGVAEPWAGLGLGLERAVMAREGFHNIRRAGRSLVYLDGARINA